MTYLSLSDNQISDLSPLAGLTDIISLDLSDNQISDIVPLAGLVDFHHMSLTNNQISDISTLAGFVDLKYIYLDNNQSSDIYPLVENTGIGEYDHVQLSGNPLSPTSCTDYIPELESRGANVTHDCP